MANISKPNFINIAMTKLKIKSSATFSSFTYSTTSKTPPGDGAFNNYVFINGLYSAGASIPYVTDNPTISKFAYDPRNPYQWIEDAVTQDYDELHEENGEKKVHRF